MSNISWCYRSQMCVSRQVCYCIRVHNLPSEKVLFHRNSPVNCKNVYLSQNMLANTLFQYAENVWLAPPPLIWSTRSVLLFSNELNHWLIKMHISPALSQAFLFHGFVTLMSSAAMFSEVTSNHWNALRKCLLHPPLRIATFPIPETCVIHNCQVHVVKNGMAKWWHFSLLSSVSKLISFWGKVGGANVG